MMFKRLLHSLRKSSSAPPHSFGVGCPLLAILFILISGLSLYAMSVIGPVAFFLIFAITLSLWLWLAPRQRQRRIWEDMGNCPNCGYDHRESHEICPECGGPISEDSRPPAADSRVYGK